MDQNKDRNCFYTKTKDMDAFIYENIQENKTFSQLINDSLAIWG